MKKLLVVILMALLGLCFSCKSPEEKMLDNANSAVDAAIKRANDDTPGEGTIRFCKLAKGWRDDACKQSKDACDAAKKNKNNKKAKSNCDQKKKKCDEEEKSYTERCSKIKH